MKAPALSVSTSDICGDSDESTDSGGNLGKDDKGAFLSWHNINTVIDVNSKPDLSGICNIFNGKFQEKSNKALITDSSGFVGQR